MELIDKQKTFSILVSQLLSQVFSMGYQVTLGEAWRSDETAALDANEGKGIVNSVHRIRLAIDLNLFKNGEYLSGTADYEPIGVYWESLSTDDYQCCWGGRFNDGNHFSIEHMGVK